MLLALEGDYCLAAILNVKDIAANDAFMHRKPKVRKRVPVPDWDNVRTREQRNARVTALLKNDYVDEYARVRQKYNWSPVP